MSFRYAARCASLLSMAVPALGAVHELLAAAPAGWSSALTQPKSDTTATFTLALTMQNIDQLESMLLSVSSPGSNQYGKYLDLEDIQSTFAPLEDAVSSVTSWLQSAGITNYAVNGAFVDFATDLAAANSLLNASYLHYTRDGVTKLRTLSLSIPDSVEAYVAVVDPGVYFGNTQAFLPTEHPTPTKRSLPNKPRQDASCETSITPACLKEMYSVGNYTPKACYGSRVGFGSFLNQSAIYSDLALFEQYNGIPAQNFTTVIIANGTNDQDPDTAMYGEADLDVQNIVGIAHPLPVTEFITGGSPPFIENIDQPTAADNQNEPYVPYYRYLLSLSNADLPQVISNSYGDEEDSVPFNYATLSCNLIGLLGLRGITVLHSSGDLGVGAGCLAPDNTTVEFNPIFPATCPFVTSVGGTVAVSPEVAWDGSSGGFSKYFTRPAYQDAAVVTFLQTVSSDTYQYYGQYTNWGGRGFPDVSAHSTTPSYQVVNAGELRPSGGTSAAAPVFAAIVALLNDALLRAGKPAVGFLNPLIYNYGGAAALNDIVSGYSIGCFGSDTQNGNSEPPGAGIVPGARWNATVGWDPVTGYGTPNFEALKTLVLSF